MISSLLDKKNFIRYRYMSNYMPGVTALHASNLFHGLPKFQNYKISVTLKVLINVQKYMFKFRLKSIPKFPKV